MNLEGSLEWYLFPKGYSFMQEREAGKRIVVDDEGELPSRVEDSYTTVGDTTLILHDPSRKQSQSTLPTRLQARFGAPVDSIYSALVVDGPTKSSLFHESLKMGFTASILQVLVNVPKAWGP